MARSRTSKAWMREHTSDIYVQRARQEGWRSRAAYKLIEIDAKDKLFKPGLTVVDLGAAPGGWSQVAARQVGRTGRVVAVDALEMQAIAGVRFVQGDFNSREVREQLVTFLPGGRAHLVISDMSPNMSGVGIADQARSMALAEAALEFALQTLESSGVFLVKVFQGEGYVEFRAAMAAAFKTVLSRKPAASRGRSSETYLVGRDMLPRAVLQPEEQA